MADGFTTKTIPQLGALASILATDQMVFQRGDEGPATRAPASALVGLLDQLGAGARAAERAEQARNEAIIAGESAGGHRYETTYAEALAAVGTYADQDYVHVFKDEGHGNRQTLYRKNGGVLAWVKDVTLSMLFEIRDRFTFIEEYINPADGIMAATLALRAAKTAAGDRGTVLGKHDGEYVIYGNIAPGVGQDWVGNGAKIKRGPAITTTTTAGITNGVSASVTVASAANFRVGMDIAIQSSATAGTGNRRITSIVGNTITVSAVFDATIGSGATLTTSFTMIGNVGDGGSIKFRGWEVDGNKSNNSGFTRWPNHNEVAIAGAGSVTEYNYVHDCQGEGIEAFGDATLTTDMPFWVQFNRIEECNGNGVHTSASYGARVLFNFIRNTNLRPNGNIGHDDGCISFSDETGHTLVMGNHLEGGLTGIGSLDAEWNAPCTLTMNTILDCGGAIEGIIPGDTTSLVHVTGNLIINSGVFNINETAGDANDGPRDWIVSGNTLINTRLFVQRARGLKLASNVAKWTLDTTSIVFDLANCKDSEVEDNRVTGGGYGIYAQGAGTAGLRLKGNTCRDNYTAGVWTSSDCPVGSVDISDQGVTVASGVSAAAAWVAIQLANGTTLRGGQITAANTSTASAVSLPNGGVGTRGAVVTGMVIDAPDVAYAIRGPFGSYNNVVFGNFSDDIIEDVGDGNTFENNYGLTVPQAMRGYTVATLPAAGTAGRRAHVTDATAPTFLGALVGGGAVKTPVFDNGVAWVAG